MSDGSETVATETFPFELRLAHTFLLASQAVRIFEFENEADRYFASAGRALDYAPCAGMSALDFEVQIRGAAWIATHDPIDADTSVIGDDAIPSVMSRRAHMRELATEATGLENAAILEGLFLRTRGEYLVLVDKPGELAIVLSDALAPLDAPFPNASPWRRLSYVIGKKLAGSGAAVLGVAD